jgi:hypothetical protein
MPRFNVVKYYEAYEEYTVEAPTAQEAEDMVMEGRAGEPDEVTVKQSDIMESETKLVPDEEGEQQRRDEKHGLYPEHEDIAN